MAMIDKCFKARIQTLHGRFPLQEFREQFVKAYAEHGLVLIQGSTYYFDGKASMTVDYHCGFIFSEERFVNIAVKLCRRWGFNVERREHKDTADRDMPAYYVTIPKDYLRRRMSSEAVGMMQTRDRSIIHANTPEGRKYTEEQRKNLWV
jgi:hypothetical protein